MSQAVLLNGILATDSQMLMNINARDEYIAFGQKLFVSPCKRAALGIVGGEFNSTEMALVWGFIVPRLAAFYLSYDAGNPLEFSEEERGLLCGMSAKGIKVIRRMFLVTQEHAWVIERDVDEGAVVSSIDPTQYWTEGSEGNFANVFYKAGFDAPEIIRRISLLANTCGGPVQALSMSTLDTFPREAKPVVEPKKPRAPRRAK
jgi:hypothetical protein